MASNVTSPTNFRADRVITATTSWPCCCNQRATSTALYAPIPPVTPRAINAIVGHRQQSSIDNLTCQPTIARIRNHQSSLRNLEFLDLALFHFLLRELHDLVAAGGSRRTPV